MLKSGDPSELVSWQPGTLATGFTALKEGLYYSSIPILTSLTTKLTFSVLMVARANMLRDGYEA